jgi:hypothetical protein
VYVPNILVLSVIQQPSGNAGYVSNKDDETTRFAIASKFVQSSEVLVCWPIIIYLADSFPT